MKTINLYLCSLCMVLCCFSCKKNNQEIKDYPSLAGLPSEIRDYIKQRISSVKGQPIKSGEEILLDDSILIDKSTLECLRLLEWNYACQLVTSGNIDINFTLEHDVDLTGFDWQPIGEWERPFTGVFDGQGHRITGLEIDFICDAGFFGSIGKGGLVRNLHLEGTVNGKGIIGGISAFNEGGTIEGCSFSNGRIMNDSHFTKGGITGYNSSGGRVYGCIVRNTIMSDTGPYTGGIVGANVDGIVAACILDGGIIGNPDNYGRFGGITSDNKKTIIACIAAPEKWEREGVDDLGAITCNNSGNVYLSLWQKRAGTIRRIAEDENPNPQIANCKEILATDDFSLYMATMNQDLKAAKIPWRWAPPTSQGGRPSPYRLQ